MIRLTDEISAAVQEETPALDIAMPRVFRRPSLPPLPKQRKRIAALARRALLCRRQADEPGFGTAYGELVHLFQPMIQWGLSCWEYLLSMQGCRFIPRSPDEKRYCRGDYKVFGEKEFHSLVHKCFKSCLLEFPAHVEVRLFGNYIRQQLWPTILRSYQSMEEPPDGRQRLLTPYSYLRCIPYRFLNEFHHHRVTRVVQMLPPKQRQVIDLYYLRFYKVEAALEEIRISRLTFRRRQLGALRAIAGKDYLSYILLTQIERY
ncbi:MAG: hypothetical protein NC910_01005 [Candidatus Omnitrophica bacterium]|nr:hypothetical protein [Candidatus Omnitrophota bacterium]